jgi:hypothetical protein
MPLSLDAEAVAYLEEEEPDEESAIAVRKLSICGKDSIPVRPQRPCHVKPASHGLGEPHRVSLGLVLQMTALSPDILSDWANSGNVSFKLEWTFLTRHAFPKFTTSHLLVQEDVADVSFGGGLGWALKIFRRFHPLQPFVWSLGEMPTQPVHQRSTKPHQPISPRVQLGTPILNTSEFPALPVSISSFSLASEPQSLPQVDPWMMTQDRWNSMSPHPQGSLHVGSHNQDPSRAVPYLDEESGDDGDQPGTPASLTTATTRQSTPTGDNDAAACSSRSSHEHIKNQDYLNSLSQQRKAAERLYANTGNSNALFSVISSAARDSEAWHPSGLARF